MPEIAHEEEDEEKSRRGGRRGRRRPARAAVWPDADCLASRASPLSQRLAPGHAPRHDLLVQSLFQRSYGFISYSRHSPRAA
eukprot:scaffold90769_cov60-Phaeocystis_antarctica.AAC.3